MFSVARCERQLVWILVLGTEVKHRVEKVARYESAEVWASGFVDRFLIHLNKGAYGDAPRNAREPCTTHSDDMPIRH